MTMTDCNGKPIAIGDKVVVIDGSRFAKGKTLTVRAVKHKPCGFKGWGARADDAKTVALSEAHEFNESAWLEPDDIAKVDA